MPDLPGLCDSCDAEFHISELEHELAIRDAQAHARKLRQEYLDGVSRRLEEIDAMLATMNEMEVYLQRMREAEDARKDAEARR